MRNAGFLLLVLLLAPTALAAPPGPLGAPERASSAADAATGDAWACLTRAGGVAAEPLQETADACVVLPCLPVFLEVDPDRPGITPVLRPECIDDAVSFVAYTIDHVRGLVGI